jgi:hypothetical protein
MTFVFGHPGPNQPEPTQPIAQPQAHAEERASEEQED